MTMRDLDTKLDVIDRVRMPDVWDRVEARAGHLPTGGTDIPVPHTAIRQRVAAGVVALAVFALVVALFVRLIGGTGPVPPVGSANVQTVTIAFSAESPTSVTVDGVRIPGEMRNGNIVTPNVDRPIHYQFFPDQIPEVVPESQIVIQGVVESRGWIDACCQYGSEGPSRLYAIDLADSPLLPHEPGTYFVELSVHIVGWSGQGAPGDDPLTFVLPVKVSAP
jgi:hypothetical protein